MRSSNYIFILICFTLLSIASEHALVMMIVLGLSVVSLFAYCLNRLYIQEALYHDDESFL